jgi:hypothetical protein
MNAKELIIKQVLKELSKYLLNDIISQENQLCLLKYYKAILQNKNNNRKSIILLFKCEVA